MTLHVDGIIRNARLATLQTGVHGDDYGSLQGCLAWHAGKIVYVGSEADCPELLAGQDIDAQQQWLTPGLIDCHTHLVYDGNRAGEFEQLRQGMRYQDIAAAGGGINSTVRATRAASEDTLLRSAETRLQCLMREGVTTVEIKSGYGLTLNDELKMLRVIRALGERGDVHVSATCLAAHTLPFDFSGDQDAYIDWITETLLPQLKDENLAEAVDVFCESIGFTAAQTRRLFAAATKLGLRVKGHVEQLSQQHGADVVAEFGGLSADHVEYLEPEQCVLLAQKDVVAVLLPGAYFYLNETRKPPIQAMRDAGVAMAVATDLNPGTSPLNSLLTAANFSAVLFGLTPAEAWAGITRHAAQALGLAQRKGQLREGFDADFLLWSCDHPRQIIHELNRFKPTGIWRLGKEQRHD